MKSVYKGDVIMSGYGVVDDLAGYEIKDIFKDAHGVAELHSCLTSQRGDYFRLCLLQSIEKPMDETEIEQLRYKSKVHEHHRHLNLLIRFGLVRVQEVDGKKQVIRTESGEAGVNAVREFERKVGVEIAEAVYSASLGPNSVRLFLRIYGHPRPVDWSHREIRYTPEEIGRFCLFLPRTVEGLSAIDKLDEAGLLVYQDDNHVHMHPLKARSFYQYIQRLHRLLPAGTGAGRNGKVAPEEADPDFEPHG